MNLQSETLPARVLLDTNVLIGAAYNQRSASSRIVELIQLGELTILISPAIEQEYDNLIPQAVRSKDRQEAVWQALDFALSVTPVDNPPVTEDRADDKFLAAALTGNASAIISNDRHLLAVHPYEGIPILRPGAFLRQFSGQDDGPNG